MKKITAVFIILVMVLCLAGCKESDETGKKRNNRSTEAVTPNGAESATPVPSGNGVDTPKLPHTDLTPGPVYRKGSVTYENFFGDLEHPLFRSQTDFIYIVEDGFPKLAEKMKAENIIHGECEAYYREEMRKKLQDPNEDIRSDLFYDDVIWDGRSDSAVFAFIRVLREYNGAVLEETMTGHSYDTQTGEELSVSDVLNDTDVFAEAMKQRIREEYESRDILPEYWEESFTRMFGFGHYEWVYGNDGIDYWIEAKYLIDGLEETVEGRFRVLDYPEAFVEKYVGAYADGLVGGREINDPADARTPIYEDVVMKLVSGVGTMSFEECIECLNQTEYAYTSVSPEEAEEWEQQPEIDFYDPVNGDRFNLFFWPKDMQDVYSSQTLSMFRILPVHLDGFLLVSDGYHENEVRYSVIDRSFTQKDGLSDQRAVEFPSFEEALDVMLQGFYLYYPEVYDFD